MQSSVGRCEAAGCDVAVLLLTGQVCTKTTGFLFVFLRRESRTRYEDFCEDERERYVADRGRAIQKRLGGAQRSTPVCAQEETCCRTPGRRELQSWLCSFCPSPFSLAHTAICAREVKPNLDSMFSMCFSIVRVLTTRISAISRLAFPCAINAATSRSRSVSPPKASLAARRGESGRERGSGAVARERKFSRRAPAGTLAASSSTISCVVKKASSASSERRCVAYSLPRSREMRQSHGRNPCAWAAACAARRTVSASASR